MIHEDDEKSPPHTERVLTGIRGLDTILRGGLFRGSVYLVEANPGSGKTILGNQVCFNHVRAGGRAVFVTLLTESHSKMLAQLDGLDFFDASYIGAALTYVTAYQALEKDRLKGLLVLLKKIVRDHDASMLVIDGVVTAGAMAESSTETKKFVHELQAFVEMLGCTTILLTGASDADQYALRTMVDGLFELHVEPFGMDAMRTIEVTKFRGGANLLGRHPFEINDSGLVVYPRVESDRGRAAKRPDRSDGYLAPFGIKTLDHMLGGGLHAGSITLTLGTPGSGKTLLGMSFLDDGAKKKERGLYFGFFETPSELPHKGKAIGFDWASHTKKNLIDVVWQPPLDIIADALVEKLVNAAKKHGSRRLFIDGMLGFITALVHQERAQRFFGALCNELRSLGVVTLFTDETNTFHRLEFAQPNLISMLDNVIFMRKLEHGTRVHKLISVPKMRGGVGDASMHEYAIGPSGFVVAPLSATTQSVVAALTPWSSSADGRGTFSGSSNPRKAKTRLAKKRAR